MLGATVSTAGLAPGGNHSKIDLFNLGTIHLLPRFGYGGVAQRGASLTRESEEEAMEQKDNPLKLKDREPRQGEQFTEPKLGGLYPVAGIFFAGISIGALAVIAIM